MIRRGNFSALQRAENSSMYSGGAVRLSAKDFSALQRAENSSIGRLRPVDRATPTFQCSSASRKFLNSFYHQICNYPNIISVLFSEPKIPQYWNIRTILNFIVKFQCSSASRKFLNRARRQRAGAGLSAISVLFSEPKIPQLEYPHNPKRNYSRFQCSSASRKFLNLDFLPYLCYNLLRISVLFSEPKIPQ